MNIVEVVEKNLKRIIGIVNDFLQFIKSDVGEYVYGGVCYSDSLPASHATVVSGNIVYSILNPYLAQLFAEPK